MLKNIIHAAGCAQTGGQSKVCANILPRQYVVKGPAGNIITRVGSLKAASRSVDRLDNAYGASVHYYVAVR